MLKLIGIKTNEGYLITDNVENKEYFNSLLGNLKINKEPVLPTFKKHWFKIKSKPEIIEKTIEPTKKYIGYKLRDISLSDRFKETYLNNEVFDDNAEYLDFFKNISSLYEPIIKETESYKELVDFEFEEILEIEIFKEPNKFGYKRAGQWNHQTYTPVTNNNIKYDFIGSIITPEILKHELSCSLSQKETYDIIRAYIKDNINSKVAIIPIDYDFCFVVKKRLS